MFQQHGLADEQSKFTATIAALSHDEDVIQKISDVLQSPDSQNPYSILRDTILARFATPDSEGLAAFFSAERRDNETITNYLARLKSLLTSAYPNQTILCGDLIKKHILDSLDLQTRLARYPYGNSDLASLASHADKLLAMVNSTRQPTSHVTLSPVPPTQQIINEMS